MPATPSIHTETSFSPSGVSGETKVAAQQTLKHSAPAAGSGQKSVSRCSAPVAWFRGRAALANQVQGGAPEAGGGGAGAAEEAPICAAHVDNLRRGAMVGSGGEVVGRGRRGGALRLRAPRSSPCTRLRCR